MKHTSLSVFDYSGKKVCDLYDSSVNQAGQAYDISVTTELSGWKELDFSLPYIVNEEDNWRWKYIKAEYQVRLKEGDKEDWFIITSPKKSKSSKKISGEVNCGHLSGVLKTKNLYLTFDDENGIGTLPYLMKQIMAGTGWSFDEAGSDIFYENYATDESAEKVEKKRSLSSDDKSGAYALISEVCDLFNAYPVFDAVNKSVTCFDLNNKKPLWEMEVGKNLTALSKESDSESIVTRLYVEGDYDEDEYVGIDNINPTGLSYLLNFDYYKSIGAFMETHQAALDKYLTEVAAIKKETMATATELAEKESLLARLWGSVNYVLWSVKNGAMATQYIGGTVEDEQKSFAVGDTMYIFTNDQKYTTEKVTVDTAMTFADNVIYVLKFIGACNGSIGAKEVAVEAKQQVIDALKKENEKETTSDATKAKNNETIKATEAAIQEVYYGSGEAENHAYTVKITSEQELSDGGETDASLMRQSTSLTLNTAAYKLSTDTTTIASDKTVQINDDGVSFTFGDYGVTGTFDKNTSPSEISGTLNDLAASLLNVSSVAKTIKLKCSGGSAKLFGTTFTFTVSAVAYSLYEQFDMAVKIAEEVGKLTNTQTEQLNKQNNIEADFVLAMGDLLRDGYWNDDNYVAGQEQYLYNDALDVMKEVSKPTVTYTVSLEVMSEAMGYTPDEVEINSKVRIYDPELDINDTVYVEKIERYIDRKDKGSVEITNEEVDISASFDSIFSRIASVADLIEQKKTLFKRAEAITSDGSLATERLNGAIDLLTTRLSSAVSNWYTDERGNIIFEAADGTSAMQLCGDGWMIADGKKDDGNWNWRTAASGQGIVADAIYTGYLSAERIEAGSITANKLASDVGKSLDLSSNESVKISVKSAVDSIVNYEVKIGADHGYFLTDDIAQTTLTASVYGNGEDVTSQYDESAFKWTDESGMETSGVRSITVAAAGTYKCQITIGERIYFDTATVAKLEDNELRFYLSCNAPSTQIYDPNLGGGYSPDWTKTNVILMPYIFKGNEQLTPSSTVTVTWAKRVGTTEQALGTYEEISESTGALTISGNILSDTAATIYLCTVTVDGREIGQESFTFTQLSATEKTKSCTLSGANVFKYASDGTVSPTSQVITCDTVNVTISQWQYRRSDGTFAQIPNSGTDASYTVGASDDIFNGDVCTIKVTTSDENVYDMLSLYKVSNGKTGDSGVSYYAYIRYSAYEDGRQMKETPTADTKYIGSYAGTSATVPAYTAFQWSKYVGSDITVESTLIEYNQVSGDTQGKPDDDDTGWSTDIPTLVEGDFLWTRTTVTFSDKSTMKTYTVSYNGKTGADGTSYYAYVRYSANADGSNMTRLPQTDSAYIGIYTGTASSAPAGYTAYTWSKLKGDDGTGVTVSSTKTYYAKTETDAQPDETSGDWQESIPAVSEGTYLWTKTVVTYSDNTTAVTYNVAYSGTNGENTAHAFLTNESISFAADSDGKVGYTKITLSAVGYVGTTKTAPIIDFAKVSNIPDGLTVTAGTSEDGETAVVIQVLDGSTLDGTSGQIGMPVQVSKDGVQLLDTTLALNWVKISKGKDGSNGEDSVTLTLYTPDGNTFLNGTGTLTISAAAYKGTTDLTNGSTATFAWSEYSGGSWTAMTQTTASISVSGEDVSGIGIFKCTMTYQSKVYSAVTTLTDKADLYQAVIASSTGDTLEHGGETSLTCLLYKNGEQTELTDGASYVWTMLNKDGSSAASYKKTGRVIAVEASEVDERATFICQAAGVQAQFTLKVNSEIKQSATEPSDLYEGMMWLDTSVTPSMLRRYDGTQWVDVGADAAEVELKLADVYAEISTSDDAIRQEVASTYALSTDLTQTQKQLKTLSEQTDDNFTWSVSQINNVNSSLSSLSEATEEQFKTIQTYMTFAENGLTIGKSGNPFTFRVVNDRLSFYMNESEVAYLSDNKLYVTEAEILTRMQLGLFAFEPQSNGNMSIVYTGGNA